MSASMTIGLGGLLDLDGHRLPGRAGGHEAEDLLQDRAQLEGPSLDLGGPGEVQERLERAVPAGRSPPGAPPATGREAGPRRRARRPTGPGSSWRSAGCAARAPARRPSGPGPRAARPRSASRRLCSSRSTTVPISLASRRSMPSRPSMSQAGDRVIGPTTSLSLPAASRIGHAELGDRAADPAGDPEAGEQPGDGAAGPQQEQPGGDPARHRLVLRDGPLDLLLLGVEVGLGRDADPPGQHQRAEFADLGPRLGSGRRRARRTVPEPLVRRPRSRGASRSGRPRRAARRLGEPLRVCRGGGRSRRDAPDRP